MISSNKIQEIISIVKPYTMLSNERIINNILSVQEIVQNNIEGDIIECGVWKGGSVMAMILALKELNTTRQIHLFDTFAGMTPPSEYDKDFRGAKAEDILQNPFMKCISHLDEVMHNLDKIGCDLTNIKFVVGDILHNKFIPEKISLLRLDTDWYESTKAELEMFYPNVVHGGIVIIDDYGYWQGSKKAVDEFTENKNIELIKIDDTGVYFVKN
jgi:O-methyltransferase